MPSGSEYVGRTIGASGLREKDVNALTLYRGTTVIPNPRADRVLEPGDRLLCFGKLESMRTMVPKKIRNQRRPEVHELPAAAEGSAIVPVDKDARRETTE